MNVQLNISPEIEASWQVPAYDLRFWTGRRFAYCVVIPVINEGARIMALLERMALLKINDSADLIIVDGGSTDGSLDADRLKDKGVRGLLVKTGPGKLSAQLRCAYAFALKQGYEGIVTIDGNDKDDPKDIPPMIKALQEGYDFVQASRFKPGGRAEHTPVLRSMAIRLVHAPLISLCSGFPWTDTTQGFRGYSRGMLLDVRVAPLRDIFITYELLAYLSCRAPRLGFRCLEVPSTRRYPHNGRTPTKISPFKGNARIFQILLSACLGRYNP